MKDNIRITSCVELKENRLYIIGNNEKNEIKCFYADKNIIPNYFLIYKGDSLTVEYEERESGDPTITSVKKWSMKNMKDRINKIIDECVAMQQKAVKDLNAFLGKYELSDSGIENAQKRAAEELNNYIDEKKAEIHRIFDEKIDQIDEEEKKALEKKNNSLQFQQIMNEKARVLKMLDLSKVKGHILQDYLQEFQDYPIAVELFQNCCLDKSNRAIFIGVLPRDTRGERQGRMRDAEADIISCLENLKKFDARGNNTRISMIMSCKEYIKYQADDFSTCNEDVWRMMKEANVTKFA